MYTIEIKNTEEYKRLRGLNEPFVNTMLDAYDKENPFFYLYDKLGIFAGDNPLDDIKDAFCDALSFNYTESNEVKAMCIDVLTQALLARMARTTISSFKANEFTAIYQCNIDSSTQYYIEDEPRPAGIVLKTFFLKTKDKDVARKAIDLLDMVRKQLSGYTNEICIKIR